ncbi:MAG TPA: GNAT family N-acetyltransferase, partial [Candidatus Binatia bacterium]|nr:GNAT family N-acetyltransferase [Candidatus Binatia bacterium]
MINPPETIETTRLRLRKPIPEDAEEIFRHYAQDSEVTKYLTWEPNRKIEETHEFLSMCLAAWEQAKSFHRVIERKKDRRLLGMITARVEGHKW